MSPFRSPCRALAPRLAACALLLVGSAPAAEVIRFLPGKTLAVVTDSAAAEQSAVAVNVTSEVGSVVLGAAQKPLAPGFYRFSPRLRLWLPPEYDGSRLKLTLSWLVDGKSVAQRSLHWAHFDPRADTYTEFDQPISLLKAAAPVLELSWSIVPVAVGEKPRAIMPAQGPSINQAAAKPTGKTARAAAKDDLLSDVVGDLQAGVAAPLSSLHYPAVLADRMTLTAVSTTLAIEKVAPEKVHVYPGEANGIEVTVRNYAALSAHALVKLELRTGLDEQAAPLAAEVEVPPHGTATHRFAWLATAREYGHEARASVFDARQLVHSASEYFSVGAPIWKTAIQGSGFLAWYGREAQLPEHVAATRRAYCNVEEAFSWQPSSWTDLNPTGDDWWTGQGNAHNSLRGLRQWMELSHAQGIKMITYSWPSASGPSGLEWGRRHPELVTHGQIGLASEFHDVEDLKLHEITHLNPAFKGLQYGVWHGLGINLGYLRTVDLGAEEIVKSAKKFGWDGVRFDSPPGWGAMNAEEMRAEMRAMGVSEQMSALMPESVTVKDENWDGEAISIRNIRWLRHRFREIGEHFATSFNYGVNVESGAAARRPPAFFRECCRGGGQIMQEAIRQSSSWEAYRTTALQQAELARQSGGYHTVFPAERAPGWARCWSAIFTFASGSHPYGDYGWGAAMPGAYSQFMTRYGEYCWDLALAPVAAEQARFTVQSESPLLWQDYLRQRTLADGTRQTVVHLITPPPADAVAPQGKGGELAGWQRQVVVTRAGGTRPQVWQLSAEPVTRAMPLEVHAVPGGFAVALPEHRLWSILVWTEPKP